MKLLGVALVAVGWLGLGQRAAACPCSDDAGSSAGLTRADERYAASLVATSRRALGRFDAFGHYSPLGAHEHESSEELLLRTALRLPQTVEWLAELGYASYRFHAPRIDDEQHGLGDALFHARLSLWDEPMPHEALAWLPALAATALVRVPFGGVAHDRSSGFGSGGAQLGLGAWELGAGLEAKRAFLPQLELQLGGEAAYRLEDHVLGRARHLGPRLDASLGMRLLPASWFSGSVAVRGRWSGDVALAGERLSGTAERLWSVVVGAGIYEARSRFRSSVTFSVDPPLAALSQGSTSAVAVSVAVGYGAR